MIPGFLSTNCMTKREGCKVKKAKTGKAWTGKAVTCKPGMKIARAMVINGEVNVNEAGG